MSKFTELATELRNPHFLSEALEALGHAPELHPSGTIITDYDGNPHPQPALVVVRKTGDFLADFGFTKAADGRFCLVVDDYDQQFRLGPVWMGRLRQTYKEKETIAMAKAKGYLFRSREVMETPDGPQVRLQFLVAR